MSPVMTRRLVRWGRLMWPLALSVACRASEPAAPTSAADSLPRFSALSAAGVAACGLAVGGAVLCWGGNSNRGLGLDPRNALADALAHPYPERNALQGPYAALSMSPRALGGCVIDAEGRVSCWGAEGPPGVTGPANVPPVLSIALSSDPFYCLVSVDHRVFCGGDGGGASFGGGGGFHQNGRLGTGALIENVRPVGEVVGGLRANSVAVGRSHGCVTDIEDHAWCWGSSVNGQLGTDAGTVACLDLSGSPHEVGVPFPCSGRPLRVSGELHFRRVVAGGDVTCGLTPTGELYCWGVGFGSAPQRVFSAVAAIGSVGIAVDGRVCVASSVGEVYCSGHNTYGEGGDTDTSSVTTHRLTSELAFASIAAGTNFTCGLTTTGAAYCWGLGAAGQLGSDDVPTDCLRMNLDDAFALTATTRLPCSARPVRVGSRWVRS